MQKRISGRLATGIVLACVMVNPGAAFSQTKKESANMPKVGDVAPDFTLKYFNGTNLTDVKLSDYHGKKNVVVAFYIFAFTGG